MLDHQINKSPFCECQKGDAYLCSCGSIFYKGYANIPADEKQLTTRLLNDPLASAFFNAGRAYEADQRLTPDQRQERKYKHINEFFKQKLGEEVHVGMDFGKEHQSI